MTRVQALEEEIRKLTPEELGELRHWLNELDWQEWDRQIERDSAEGKLETLLAEAEAAHRAGKSTKFEALRGAGISATGIERSVRRR